MTNEQWAVKALAALSVIGGNIGKESQLTGDEMLELIVPLMQTAPTELAIAGMVEIMRNIGE